MIIGIPKESQDNEYRVSIVTEGVNSLCRANHQVLVEAGAGIASGISDDEYKAVGADIINDRRELFAQANMIVKVKQPIEAEFDFFSERQILFCYLFPSTRKKLTNVILDKKMTAIAYENVREDNGSLPLLIPMSEIAGKMSIFIGAQYLQMIHGGCGIALAKISGLAPPRVLILGAGTVGSNAALTAASLGAEVILLEQNRNLILHLAKSMPTNVIVLPSNELNVKKYLQDAVLLVNAAVVSPGTVIVTRDMLKLMKPGAVIVDVTAEENGAIETIVPKTHSNPTYIIDGVLHYCVPNIPGVVPKTSSSALSNATLPYIMEIANKGCRRALAENVSLLRGLCFIDGKTTHLATAEAQGLQYYPPEEAIKSS